MLGDIIWRGRPVFKDCDGTFCDITPLVRYFVMGHFGLDIFTDDTVCTYHCDATMGMFCDRTFCDWSFAILRYIMYSKYFAILLFVMFHVTFCSVALPYRNVLFRHLELCFVNFCHVECCYVTSRSVGDSGYFVLELLDAEW